MKLFPLVVPVFFCVLPKVCEAQCHHSSFHSHSSGHHSAYSHTGHVYYSHPHGHSNRYGSGKENRIIDPRKGINEVDVLSGALPGTQILDDKVKSATPAYLASYKYYVSDGLAFSLTAGVQLLSGKDTCNCHSGTPGNSAPTIYNFKENALTIAAGLTWLYVDAPACQVYGGIEAGITIINESDHYPDNTTSAITNYKLNAQATYIGVRCGKALGGFIELGFGYKGLVAAGLSYHAGWKKAHRFS